MILLNLIKVPDKIIWITISSRTCNSISWNSTLCVSIYYCDHTINLYLGFYTTRSECYIVDRWWDPENSSDFGIGCIMDVGSKAQLQEILFIILPINSCWNSIYRCILFYYYDPFSLDPIYRVFHACICGCNYFSILDDVHGTNKTLHNLLYLLSIHVKPYDCITIYRFTTKNY